jgi:hypothetical protein
MTLERCPDATCELDCGRLSTHEFSTVLQIYSKLHKPPLKVNNFPAFLIIGFRNARRTTNNRYDINSRVCHAELVSASKCTQE